ncbi:hypothetical protein BOO86_15085 [Mycobacterium sp. CBMA 234]|uniref:hypothetical protein n=1 Tax=Mycolicibacterium sp. CBMA 234 TaxID=1918495 RepID=UPI0012DBD1F2|nr:hypothetical protein [Mycolicibacterium sp. CBMA 234]MUL65798.1 hypothetical protein [Mycolicibacterium sp. CBMA 234]
MIDGTVTGDNLVVTWLRDVDEQPHQPGEETNWSENWLTYGWAPEQGIGIYFHIGRHPGSMGIYETTFNVYLPGDRFLTHRGFAAASPGGSPRVGAVSFHCEEPFQRWRKQFRGAARATTGDALRAGPLLDGSCVDVDLDLTITAASPPFDFGAEKLEQSWGSGHYEQHHQFTATLIIGAERFELRGTGLRDHSWGPRDWSGVGDTTWYHGHFPSGRSFMVVSVPGRPPFDPFVYGVVSDDSTVQKIDVVTVPPVTAVYHHGGSAAPDSPYELELRTADGPITVRCDIVQSMPMTFIPPTQIGIGTHRGPQASHENVETITRFTLDGEVGYGLVTACRDLTGPYCNE